MTTLIRVKKFSLTLGLGLLLASLGQGNAQAAPLDLPDVPLSIYNNIEHNLLLTFDDSGSMTSGEAPDTISGDSGTNRYCSSTYNGMAYNPAVVYTPPPIRTYPENSLVQPKSLPDSVFTAAPVNGFLLSSTVDLSTGYRPVRDFTANGTTLAANTSYGTCGVALTAAGAPAFYFVYNSSLPGCSPQTTTTENNDACYTQVNVSASSGPGGSDEQVNFANWYSYYRTRNLAAKSAAGRAFQGLPNNVRVSGQHLNNTGSSATRFTTTVGVMKRFCDDPTSVDALCKDATTARTDFFTKLYNSPASGRTPLRAAMRRAGDHFGSGNTGSSSPYRVTPGDPVTASNPEYSCRKNFHVLLTDGYWNNDTGVVGNLDDTSLTLGNGGTYTPIAPYRDAWAGTLADNAFNYWYRDLRPDLTNNVPTFLEVGTLEPVTPPAIPDPFYSASLPWDPRNNPANWQHMQTFTIGMGIPGTLNPANYLDTTLPNSAGDWDELLAGTTAWPQPCDGCATDINNIDDLWHAAVNSRGSYHSARDPDALLNAFNKIISKINRDTGSAAGLGASGNSTSGGGTSIFQSAYDTGKWVGRLLSRTVDANGVPQALAWEAGTGLAGGSGAPGLNSLNYDNRKIISYNPLKAAGTRGVPFRWDTTDLSAAQQTALRTNAKNTVDPATTGEARLNYLRGDSTNEGAGLNFRVRGCYDRTTVESQTPTIVACPANVGKLGDIINSSPVYVGKPDFTYPDSLESIPYSTFVKDPLNTGSSSTRLPMVYVGANDGMLHGFRSVDGAEEIAYVPNLVYSNITTNNLSLLSDEFYSHRYYVDATPTVGDVFIGGAWRTMLVGGLRKGGKGYYALDVTDPSTFSEANAAQIAKWEFTDPDMGFSYSQATITKIADSSGTGTPRTRWVAIFGNGYNNTNTGRAMIFVVDIATGALIQKIDTGVSGGGGSVTTPNGMATPAVVDMNDDYIADYIYAGDLLGNMWRIDVRSDTPSNWNTAANVTLLFTAKDNAPTPVRQPITTKPATGFHPSGFGGLLVYFGTGKYLEGGDNAATGTPQRQSFYAIYDRGVTGRRAEPSRKEAVTIARSDLLQQTIIAGATVGAFNTRNVTDLTINWRLDRTSTTTHLGWYVDLPDFGEKQVTNPLLREGRIIFTTLSPPTDACAQGSGTGWLMELDATNGGRLDETLDLNGDGLFNGLDNSALAYGAAGAQVIGGGSTSSPIVLTNPDGPPPPLGTQCSETKLTVTSAGDIISMKESCLPSGPEAWRQLR